MRDPGEPAPVLHGQWLIEPHLLPNHLHHLQGRIRRHHGANGVSRGEVQERKDNDRHAEQRRHAEEQSSENIAPHPTTPPMAV